MWCLFNSSVNKKQPPAGIQLLRLFVVLVVALWIAGPVLADEPYSLDEVVVTASRIEAPLAEAPANVTVITAEQIRETGAQTLVDVFDREPGVFTQNLLGNPKTANIDIRGYGRRPPKTFSSSSTAGALTPSTSREPTSRRYPSMQSRGSRCIGVRRASFTVTTPPRAR